MSNIQEIWKVLGVDEGTSTPYCKLIQQASIENGLRAEVLRSLNAGDKGLGEMLADHSTLSSLPSSQATVYNECMSALDPMETHEAAWQVMSR